MFNVIWNIKLKFNLIRETKHFKLHVDLAMNTWCVSAVKTSSFLLVFPQEISCFSLKHLWCKNHWFEWNSKLFQLRFCSHHLLRNFLARSESKNCTGWVPFLHSIAPHFHLSFRRYELFRTGRLGNVYRLYVDQFIK